MVDKDALKGPKIRGGGAMTGGLVSLVSPVSLVTHPLGGGDHLPENGNGLGGY